MKVRVGSLWIAGVPGDAWKSQVANFRITKAPLSQTVQAIRAEAVRLIDRGNAQVAVEFDVSRLHASVQAAEAFLLDHTTAIPRQADVLFQSGEGETAILRHIDNAIIANTDSSHIGATTKHHYSIIGGSIY